MVTNLPIPGSDQGLTSYFREIKKFPMLSIEEEYMLAKAWVDRGDTKAAHRLVTSHLRLAAKIANGYRGYGLAPSEIVSEANVGLMQAVKRFDPEKGFRLATYAMWWIRASIQEYILRSWSLVKMGTTSAQKKLFFNLRKAKSRIGAMEEGDLNPDHLVQIADDLGVSTDEVVNMNRRLSGSDASLNSQIKSDGEGTSEWQDWLEDETANHAAAFEDREELEERSAFLSKAMEGLTEREQTVIKKRRLSDDPATLEDLSKIFSVSRERIRQIEGRAFEKLQEKVKVLEAESMQAGT